MKVVTLCISCVRSGVAFLPILLGAPAAGAGIEPHHETTYLPLKNNTEIQWSSCGATVAGSGCDAGGSFTGFKRACALLEGEPTVTLDPADKTRHTVTRNVYVVDGGSAATDPVVLKVYKRTDIVAIPDVILSGSSVLTTTITLPLKASPGTGCAMAANKHVLVIGTTTSFKAVLVNKLHYTRVLYGGSSPPFPVQSIQADANGYVTVTHSGVFDIVFPGPSGFGHGGGGGSGFVVDARNGHSIP